MLSDKIKQGDRETRIEAAIGLSVFAVLWIALFGGTFLYLPFAQCQLGLSSDVAASCERALKRGFLTGHYRSQIQSKIIGIYADNQNYDKVIEFLAAFERTQPLNSEQFLLRGQAFAKLQKIPEARESFLAALKLSPGNEDAFNYLITQAMDTGDYKTARTDAANFLAKNPTSGNALSWAAWVEDNDGQPDKAIAFFKQAIAVAPDNAFYHSSLGDIYRKTGRNSLSLASYEASLKLEPANAYVRSNRAELMTQKGDHRSAQADYIASLELYRETYVLVALAKSYHETGDIEKAIPLLDEALQESEGAEWVHSEKIALLARANKLDDAAAALDALEKRFPASAFVMVGQGIIHEMKGQLHEAYEAYDNAAELMPHDSQTHIDVARMLLKLNQPKDALPYANKAIDATKRQATLYIVRAAIHAALNDPAAAVTDYGNAIQLEPANPKYQREAFDYAVAKGFHTHAASMIGAMRKADPDSPIIVEFEKRLALPPPANP